MCRLRGHEVCGVHYQARVRYSVHDRYCKNNKLGLVRGKAKNCSVKMCWLQGHEVCGVIIKQGYVCVLKRLTEECCY